MNNEEQNIQMLQEQLENFKKELKEKTTEELEKLLEETDKEVEAMNEEAAEKKFELKCNKSERKGYGTVISNFLQKSELPWNQALLMLNIIDFWRGSEQEIAFPVLDMTVRTLGTLQFKGLKQFQEVRMVNEFLNTLREDFAAFTDKIFEISSRQAAVMAELDLRHAEDNQVQTINE